MEHNMKTSASKSSTYLKPLIEKIPLELKNIPRWVVWKKDKIPFDARYTNSTASVSDEKTWSTYEQALTAYEEGGYEGIGFVFNGDGIVGIDIDNCVNRGKPSDAAISLLQRIGCSYIEISPSGTGLHGLGKVIACNPIGRPSRLNGLQVEMYSTGRFFTVTGHAIFDGHLEILRHFNTVYDELKPSLTTEVTEATEATEATDSVTSVGKFIFPSITIPSTYGERNTKLFLLARHLKGLYPEAKCDDVIPLVKEWHSMCINEISTKEFFITRLTFENAWSNVKHPSTFIFERIEKEKPSTFDSPAADLYGQVGGLLFYMCQELQKFSGNEPFFISCRTAGKQLNIDHKDAANLLSQFVSRNWLILVKKGSGKTASRYRIT